MSARLARVPIRLRVTLAFVGVMAVVLAAAGLFVYLRFEAESDATLRASLGARVTDLEQLVQRTAVESGPLQAREEDLAQITDPSGRVIDSTRSAHGVRLLTLAQTARAARGRILVTGVVGDEMARLLAEPATARGGRRLIVVAGTPTDEREDAVHHLGGLLLVGGAFILLLAGLGGYLALSAALRPVEEMRRRAAEIEDATHGPRLPVPPADDEVGRLGRTLNDMLGRLESAFDRERSFVADASHELRTPLAILKGELELARRRERTRREIDEALASASEETDRVISLAEDLLVVARSQQGRLPVRAQPVAAGDVLQTVAARFAGRARDTGRQLRVQDGDVELHADALRLEQAVGNLVDNALRYGGREIVLSARVAGDHAELHVRDDGDGFPPGFLARAFERFTRADAARGRGGTGLGLSIVEAIAVAHGGRVGAVNAEPGADVWVAVPVRSGII